MTVEYFAIRDGARRKATPCAFMRYADETGFEIDIDSDISADEVPAFFVPFVEKEERHIDGDLALRWVRERVPPPGRQNLGEILDAHGLSEYSELALLRAGRGESSQDSFVVEEIDEASYESGRVDRTMQRRQKLGQEIKARRMGLGMSQRELADAIGIDQPALSRIEAGKANVTFDLLANIDEVLSGDSRPMLSLARRALWNAERRELHGLIKRCAPSLAQVYKRLIDELEAYSEDAVSAVADSRIISWCFEELGLATAGQGKEASAFEDCMSWLLVLESTLKETFEKLLDANEELFELTRRANRVDAKGKYVAPGQDDFKLFVTLFETSDMQDAVIRELRNPHWLDELSNAGLTEQRTDLGTGSEFGNYSYRLVKVKDRLI